MIAFVHEYWLTLLSGVIGLFFIADCVRIEREHRKTMAEQTALRVRLIADAKEREDAYLALYRDFERLGAFVWNGVGPERECLLRVRWNDSGDAEWIHFDFQTADGEYDDEGTLRGNPDRYRNESSSLYVPDVTNYGKNRYESDDFTVTHWAEIPEVSP